MNRLILILLIVLVVLFMFYNSDEKPIKEPFHTTQDVLDIRTDYRILPILRKMLKDVSSMLVATGIRYWIDSGTLHGAFRYQDIIPSDDDADICILFQDKQKFISLEGMLNQMGYGLVKFWGGYRIFPFNGINVKYYNRVWAPNHVTKEVEDREYFNYRLPYLDVFICHISGDKVVYTNPSTKRVFSGHYHKKKDLFPLKKYRFNNFYLLGPNNPKPYLTRVYGRDWASTGHRTYDKHDNRFIPLLKGKVIQKRDRSIN